MNPIHFKLVNGDEILCEVLEEPSGEDLNLVIRNALKIVTVDKHEQGYRYYSFRPWMVYQDRQDYFQLLNYNHIIGEAKPNHLLEEQYKVALDNEQQVADARESDDGEEDTEYEEVKARLLKLLNDGDSVDSESNIIYLDKDKLH